MVQAWMNLGSRKLGSTAESPLGDCLCSDDDDEHRVESDDHDFSRSLAL